MIDTIATLTSAIAAHERALLANIPSWVSQEALLAALVRAQDRLLADHDLTREPPFDLIHGSRLANPGGSLALALVLEANRETNRHESDTERRTSDSDLGAWASAFLDACARIADARQVLVHLASGFMRGEVAEDGSLRIWIAQKRFPPTWRERIDLAWWDARAHRLASSDPIAAMNWQFGYLPDAVVGGLPARIWIDAVQILVGHYRNAGTPIPDADLRTHLTDALSIGSEPSDAVLSALTLDEANAAWHATVPGIAAAPLVRVSPTTVMPSQIGMRTQPLLFLARELRRRDAQSWHNAAHQREAAFRHDLAEIFADKRFVHAPARIQLKRDGGSLRTDIDAAIFDRKTGTLAIFELKSQDPFVRTLDELDRRRDNVLAANRQLSGILDWIARHKADEILDRIDHQTAKRFHVQRVLPFVLARSLVHFNDGPAPDKRAAWGTWPDVLRLHDAGTIVPTTANPLQALFTRLRDWPGDLPIPQDTHSRTIRLDGLTVTITASRPD